jgi:GntR family transcriptional regulator / MocR family aminotransferase
MEPLIDRSSGTTSGDGQMAVREVGGSPGKGMDAVDTTAPRSRLRRTRGPDAVVSLDGSGPRYQQIYRSLRAMILAGDLRNGSRLPATRTLAEELGVSRNVVLLAYRHLLAEGYARGLAGSGSYVSPELPDPILKANEGRVRAEAPATPRLSAFGRRLAGPLPQPGRVRQGLGYDFRYGLPVADAFPFNLWRKLVASEARRTSADSLSYGPPEGHAPLRKAIAEYLRRSRGVRCDDDQVIVVNGSQQALDLASRILIDPGDRVAIEEPHYPGAREAFLGAGARLIPVSVDDEGLDVTELGPSTTSARFVFVTPSHQFPTGAVMSLARRFALLRWADKTGAYIVEDDYESEYRYGRRPVEAMQGLDRSGRVIYIGTLSKILFPALRLGYVVLPKVLVGPFRAAKRLADRYTPTFTQVVLARFIREGHFERHVRRARAILAGRRQALLEAVESHLKGEVAVSGTEAGLHLVLWVRGIRAGRTLEALIARAADSGVGIYSVAPYYLTPPRRAGLLLGYAGLDEAAIRTGIERLAMILRDARGRSS